MNISKLMTPTVPEFPFATIVMMIVTFSIVLISRMIPFQILKIYILNTPFSILIKRIKKIEKSSNVNNII